jgi:alkylated DNA repair dioxygenase AlkB
MTTNQLPENLLPYDGETLYFGKVLTLDQAQHYYDVLMTTIRWKHDEAVIFGKHIITKRKVAWYGEAGFEYTYSNTTKSAIEWTIELLELKKIVEQISGTTFNSCLLNLYHDGDEGVSWHSDNEKALGTNTIIASISLGAERKFMFKHKNTKETIPVFLENGSLLVMQGETQQHWLHSIPKTKKISTPRINLTFRKFIG